MAQLMEKTLRDLKDTQKDVYIIMTNSITYYGKMMDYDNQTIILTDASSTVLVIVRSSITSMSYEP